MKKICMLVVALVLAGVMGSCTKFQTIQQCKSDCDSRFRDNFLNEEFLNGTFVYSLYEKNRCYNKCDRKY